jgi:hypothetical protein
MSFSTASPMAIRFFEVAPPVRGDGDGGPIWLVVLFAIIMSAAVAIKFLRK